MVDILVLSPVPTHPQDAGNRARIFALLSGLKTAGHRVHLVFVRMEAGDEKAMQAAWDSCHFVPYRPPLLRRLKKIWVEWPKRLGLRQGACWGIDDWYPPSLSGTLQKIIDRVQPDVLLVEYVFLSKALSCGEGKVLKVLDTHDVFGDRHLLYRKNGLAPQWFFTTVADEQKALDRADVVVAIQNDEAAYFSRLTGKQVLTVGHLPLIASPDPSTPPDVSETCRILFVASANLINVEAIRWFVAEVFPYVRRRHAAAVVEIVGACAERMAPQDGLVLTGRVDDLAPYYRRAAVVINPILFGTGLKIKTIEALAQGRPLVTTSVGAAGLDAWKGRAFLVADSPADFIEAVDRIFSSQELRASLIENSLAFTRETHQSTLQPLLAAIAENLAG